MDWRISAALRRAEREGPAFRRGSNGVDARRARHSARAGGVWNGLAARYHSDVRDPRDDVALDVHGALPRGRRLGPSGKPARRLEMAQHQLADGDGPARARGGPAGRSGDVLSRAPYRGW